jgi:hypothetical protein
VKLEARRRIFLAVVVLPLVAILGALGTARVPIQVAYWKWRLGSVDPTTRSRARVELLRLGRPAIDDVFPELVAGEVMDLLATKHGKDLLFVGARSDLHHESAALFYAVDEILTGVPLPKGYTWRFETRMNGPVAHALLGAAADPPKRELVLGVFPGGADSKAGIESWLAVPLDDDLAPLVLETVRARVAKR